MIVTTIEEDDPGTGLDAQAFHIRLAHVQVDGHRPEGAICQTVGVENAVVCRNQVAGITHNEGWRIV